MAETRNYVSHLFNYSIILKLREDTLQKFIEAKNQRKESTIEATLYPIIVNLISTYGNEIPASITWDSIKSNVEGHWDERRPNEYQTSEYGTIYRNTITNIIRDKFGAKPKHKETGNVLIFNLEKVVRAGKIYNRKINIQTKLRQTEDHEGSEGLTQIPDKAESNNDKESAENGANAEDSTNTLQDIHNRKLSSSSEPSEPSEPSDTIIRQERILHRIGRTDNWECQSCILTGDRHFMKVHVCSSTKRRH